MATLYEQWATERGLMNPSAPQQTAAPRQPKKKKNFWLDQISTVGGIGGGILGSLVTPIAGTAAGAGIGSGLGETLENALSGESLTKNVAKESALGAVFGAGPIKLLKGGAALATGKGLEAASQAALTPLRKAAGKAVTDVGDDLLIKQFRFTPTQLKNFKGKFGEDASEVIKRYGLKNVDDVAAKGIEPLQQQFDDAIGGITGVTKENLKKSITGRVTQLSKAGPSDTKALAGNLQKEADALLKPFGDVIDAKELNIIRRQFDDLVNYTEKAANPSRYGVNKRMADSIRETLQGADQTGTLKNVGRELQKVRQFADNAAKQSQLGRGSLPAGLTNLIGGGVGAGAAGGPLGALGGAAATQVVNSGGGRRALARGAGAIGSKLTAAGEKAAGQSLKGIAGRLGGAGAIGGVVNQGGQQEPSTLEDSLTQFDGVPGLYDSPTGNLDSWDPNDPMAQNPNATSSPYSRENLMADMKRDPRNADKYVEYFAMLDKVFGQPEQKPLGPEAQKRSLTAQSGLRSLGTLEDTLGTDPGAFQRQALPNPLGITSRLTGTTDVRAATDNIVDVIARLRSGAAITDSEAARFARFLPQPGDSKESALKKLQSVRAELQSFVNPARGGGSIEEALMQMQ